MIAVYIVYLLTVCSPTPERLPLNRFTLVFKKIQ